MRSKELTILAHESCKYIEILIDMLKYSYLHNVEIFANGGHYLTVP